MYAQDYDEILPSEDYDYNGNGTYKQAGADGTGRAAIKPYVKNVQLYFCSNYRPSNRFDGSLNDCGLNASYAINNVLQGMRALHVPATIRWALWRMPWL